MSDDDSPPLPPYPQRQRGASSESGGSESDLVHLPPPPGTTKALLEDIPMPSGHLYADMDIDLPAEIPLPAPADTSSSRYSPSHVLGGDDEDDVSSPSYKKSVLGKAQAKKRLLAFSAAKAAAAASSASIVSPTSTLLAGQSAVAKKLSPLKPLSLKQKPEPVLAIQTIKDEETQLKKMLAMNSLLADKLHQVKLIATTVPALSSNLTESDGATAAVEGSEPPQPQTAIVKPILAVSEPTVDSSSRDVSKRSNKKSKRRYSSSRSSSRSRSPSPDRKGGRKRYKRSKSRSRSKERRKRSGRSRSRDRDRKNRRSKSRSRSPSHDSRKPDLRRVSPDRDKGRRKRSDDRPSSPAAVKSRDRDRDRDRRDRRRSRSGDRGGASKRSVSPLPKPGKAERNPEFAKIRKSRMPEDWAEFRMFEYNFSDINLLWNQLRDKEKRTRSGSESPNDSPKQLGFEQPTKLSKTLGTPPSTNRLVLASGLVSEYPAHLTHYTKHSPRLQYGFNRLSLKGYYKSRAEIYKGEETDILDEMDVIMQMTPSPTPSKVTAAVFTEGRPYFSDSEATWGTVEGGPAKGILISHLYSEDEESKSPFPVMKDDVMLAVGTAAAVKESSEEEGSDDDGMSIDSTPSPLLKTRYAPLDDEPPSPLLLKPEKVEEPLPPSPSPPRPLLASSILQESTGEEESEVKVMRKVKKEKKVKRKTRKRERTSSEEIAGGEERHKRKREKKRSKRKESSSEEEEVEKKGKAKKKKGKKDRDRGRERSPSTDGGNDDGKPPPPPPGGNSGGLEPPQSRGDDQGKEKRKGERSKDNGSSRKDKDRGHGGGHHGGRRRDFLIDPDELTLSPFLANGELEGRHRDFEVYEGEAVKLDPEAQKILSSFETDEFFQLFLNEENSSHGDGGSSQGENSSQGDSSQSEEKSLEEAKEEVEVAPCKTVEIEKASEKSTSKREEVQNLEREFKDDEKSKKSHEISREVKGHRSDEYRDDRDRSRSGERRSSKGYVRSSRRSRSRSRSRSPDDRYYSHRSSRHYHHHRYRRRSESDERERYYRYRHHYHHRHSSYRHHESPRDRDRRRSEKESPPLQLNVADSTISDAELDQKPSEVSPGATTPGGVKEGEGGAVSYDPFDEDVSTGSGKGRNGGYMSPPRRLSLDERLEVEMGIKLTEEVPKPVLHPAPYYLNGKGIIPIPPPPFYQGQPHGAHPFSFPPPPPTSGTPFGKGPPAVGNYWPHQPTPFGMPMIPNAPFPRPRQQSQVIQMGDMVRVLPAELPSAPITITCSTYFGDKEVLNGQLKNQGVKRVVTIKVPVVPFNVPIVLPVDPREEERALRRRRREERRAEKKRLEKQQRKAVKASGGGGVEEVVKKEEVEDEVSPEELALLKEAISESFEEGEEEEGKRGGDGVGPSEAEAGSEVDGESILEKVESTEEKAASDCAGGPLQSLTQRALEGPPALETKNFEWSEGPVPILPPPDSGILVPFGLRERTGGKKSVKFADGIHPGFGGAEEGGEEMASPPPPPSYPYKKSFTKDKGSSGGGQGSKKRKIKVKVLRRKKGVEVDENAEPPPAPPLAYPFCPIGILYQVCPQYAVLYAQTMAEKGYDIVFQPSTQHPYGEEPSAGIVTDVEVKPPASPVPCPPGDELAGWVPPPVKAPPQTVSQIPTILTGGTRKVSSTLNLEEIEPPRNRAMTEISVPPENPNLLVISPSKVPSDPRTQPRPHHPHKISPTLPVPLKRKKKTPAEVSSISIPLSRIVAAKGALGGSAPQGLYHDLEYDFTPTMVPPPDLSIPPPAFAGGTESMDYVKAPPPVERLAR